MQSIVRSSFGWRLDSRSVGSDTVTGLYHVSLSRSTVSNAFAIGTNAELHCWSSWTEGDWTFMLLARLNSPPQFVLVSMRCLWTRLYLVKFISCSPALSFYTMLAVIHDLWVKVRCLFHMCYCRLYIYSLCFSCTFYISLFLSCSLLQLLHYLLKSI